MDKNIGGSRQHIKQNEKYMSSVMNILIIYQVNILSAEQQGKKSIILPKCTHKILTKIIIVIWLQDIKD